MTDEVHDPTPPSTAIEPMLLPGRNLDLVGRGRLFVRDSGGTPDQPVVVLLHGWLATADLNWGFSAMVLAAHARVISFDQRGHGSGLRPDHRFSFSRCAGDVIAVLDALEIQRAVAVGYSMGGPIALTLARRHQDRVAGMVLCATAPSFSSSPISRLGARPLGTLASITSALPNGRALRSARRSIVRRRASGPWQDWITSELGPSDLALMFGAGAALARFNAWPWLDQLKVPAAVVVTDHDSLVRPETQRALARALPDATVQTVDGDHLVCFDEPAKFTPALVAACQSVDSRAHATPPSSDTDVPGSQSLR